MNYAHCIRAHEPCSWSRIPFAFRKRLLDSDILSIQDLLHWTLIACREASISFKSIQKLLQVSTEGLTRHGNAPAKESDRSLEPCSSTGLFTIEVPAASSAEWPRESKALWWQWWYTSLSGSALYADRKTSFIAALKYLFEFLNRLAQVDHDWDITWRHNGLAKSFESVIIAD